MNLEELIMWWLRDVKDPEIDNINLVYNDLSFRVKYRTGRIANHTLKYDELLYAYDLEINNPLCDCRN